jgi:hypothetical protein
LEWHGEPHCLHESGETLRPQAPQRLDDAPERWIRLQGELEAAQVRVQPSPRRITASMSGRSAL